MTARYGSNNIPVATQVVPLLKVEDNTYCLKGKYRQEIEGKERNSLSPEVKENVLGFAMAPDGGGWGNRSYISSRRANDAARECGASPGLILGLAATHELGHC
jgi:hypothetical protein